MTSLFDRSSILRALGRGETARNVRRRALSVLLCGGLSFFVCLICVGVTWRMLCLG